MNNKVKTILGLIAFAILIGGAYLAYNFLSDKYSPDRNSGSDKSIGQSIQGTEPGTADTDSQEFKAVDFSVENAAGETVKLSEAFGKPIVVNFWASWCGPCRDEMPHFDTAYADYKDEVVFMMVDLVDGQRETVESGQAYIDSQDFKFPVYFDTEQKAAYAYMIQSIPTTLFIDRNGNIVEYAQGSMDEKTLNDYIEMIK